MTNTQVMQFGLVFAGIAYALLSAWLWRDSWSIMGRVLSLVSIGFAILSFYCANVF